MKTPMQELQESITELINASKGDDTRTGDYRIGLHQALSLIDLEAEKEQIKEAYRMAKYGVEFGKEFLDSDDYFTQTFKTEQ